MSSPDLMAAISSGSHPKKGSPFRTPQPLGWARATRAPSPALTPHAVNPKHHTSSPGSLKPLQTILKFCILFLLFLPSHLCLKSQFCPRCDYTFLSAPTPLAPKPPSGETETLLVPGGSAHGMPCPHLGHGVNKL